MELVEVDPRNGFQRVTGKTLHDHSDQGSKFVKLITDLVRPLAEAYYYDHNDPMHMVIGRGNKRPMHQDIRTGGNVYEDSHTNDKIDTFTSKGLKYTYPPHGLRVLIDLGSFEEPHNSRIFKIEENIDDNYVQKLVTTNRIIAMDAGAAGYDRRTQFYHGRFGDGITVQIDFSIRRKVQKKKEIAKTWFRCNLEFSSFVTTQKNKC